MQSQALEIPYRTQNPATGEVLETFSFATEGEVDAALSDAERAFDVWSDMEAGQRIACFERLNARMGERRDTLATLISLEMGKPFVQAQGEIDKCRWLMDFYATAAEGFLSDDAPQLGGGKKATVTYQPLGIVFSVMPWNFPFWQVMRFTVPAMLAGNTTILKHAENVPRCAAAIGELFEEAGFPEGAFRQLYATHEQASRILADVRVQGLTVTGSEGAGRALARQAGQNLTKSVLELGGSDPFVVFSDADMETAVQTAVKARFQNTGQSCIAAKRFLIDERIYATFLGKFQDGISKLTIGNPLEEEVEVDLGPMAREDLRDHLRSQISESARSGAVYDVMREAPENEGFYQEAGTLTEVKPGTPAYEEELFGPVAVVMPFGSEEEALKLANDTRYGLGASVWTQDERLADRMARRLFCGSVAINDMLKSDPRVPFGGVKQSGYGRELGLQGIREFTNVKSIIR